MRSQITDARHRQEDKITSAAMTALFEAIAARHPTATAIPVVIDDARYNISREIREWFARHGIPDYESTEFDRLFR